MTHKFSFLFGAGAEKSFELIDGQNFAFDLFRNLIAKSNRVMKDNNEKYCNYLDDIFNKIKDCSEIDLLNKWLPENFPLKGTSYKISPDYCVELLKNTLEENREIIINKYMDKDSESVLDEGIRIIIDNVSNKYKCNFNCDYYINKVSKYYSHIFKKEVIDISNLPPLSVFYKVNVDDYQIAGAINSILGSNYFSLLVYSILSMVSAKDVTNYYKDNISKAMKYLRSVIQFIVGADAFSIMDKLNRSFNLDAKNDNCYIDGLDELWNFDDIISLDYAKLSLDGVKSLFTENCECSDIDEACIIKYVCYSLFKDIVVSYLDYKKIIDSNWMYLYSPRRNWSKFVKISVFLLGVRNFIIDLLNKCDNNLQEDKLKDSYYYDVFTKFDVAALGTTNYTPLLKIVFDYCKLNKSSTNDVLDSFNPCFFNGSLYHWFSPCTNEVISSLSNDKCRVFTNFNELKKSNLELSYHTPYDAKSFFNSSIENYFYLPLIFTQNGTRPMTDVEFAQDFVNYYHCTMEDAEAVCAIGFGFGETDSHVNGIIRKIMNNGKKLLIIVTSVNQMKDDYVTQLKLRLRLNDYSTTYVLGVDDKNLPKKLYSFKSESDLNDYLEEKRHWYDIVNLLIVNHN